MDLSTLDTRKAADEGAELVLEHPVTGEPLDVAIRLLGSDSSAYRKAVKRIADKRSDNKKKRVSLDELEEQGADLLAGVTVSWKNLERDGEPVECTEDNARAVYMDFPWIREQVDRFVADRANFFPKSSRS